jgi:hypothetical protein
MSLLHFVPKGGLRGVLFSKYNLAASLQQQEAALSREIAELSAEYIVDVTPEAVTAYLREKYTIEMPQLLESKVEYSEAPGKLDISRDYNRAVRDRSRPVYIPAIEVSFHIPVEGQADLFDCAPSVIYMGEGPPNGRVADGEVSFVYNVEDVHPPTLQKRLDADLSRFNYVAKDVAKNIDEWNAKAHQLIAARIRERVVRIETMRTGFRFPMRKRSDATVAPIVRRKILPPRAHGEPHLALQQYEEVLTALQNAALTFERAPSAFANMKEEDIRQHLLITLNGMFEGNAGAEVFNGVGKTDILIRVEGKTIFIAECKFWKGEQSLKKAIDQLLGYTSWRDTKTALIVLNRGGRLSTILKAIPTVVLKHNSFVREESYSSETGFRYVLQNRDDPERELVMTVMAFDVPSPS